MRSALVLLFVVPTVSCDQSLFDSRTTDASSASDGSAADGTVVYDAAVDDAVVYDAGLDASPDFCLDSLLVDPSFESSTQGWTCTNCIIQLVSGVSVSGSKSLEACPMQDDLSKNYMDVSFRYSHASAAFLPTGEYSFAVQIRGEEATAYTMILGTASESAVLNSPLSVTSIWQPGSLSLIVSKDDEAALDLAIRSNSLPATSNCINLDNVCLRLLD